MRPPMDPFDNQPQEAITPEVQQDQFPNFNTGWLPVPEEELTTRTAKNLEKGSQTLKKASGFYFYGLGLAFLLIILPAIIRLFYEFSAWAFEKAGTIFP